ncbi:uncharacterized protein LOC123705257 [Colias croceus]|uniref:uncharacterized protein LOC123696960 n=1 Tax=Colias crocea TaxID=72248 RepID=UPI001E281384|nr:uncharacterized protein LOC123696960 [Colias croceus]XP_045509955.1 uncharacterized protein LOC123705257 [Colias croceus]
MCLEQFWCTKTNLQTTKWSMYSLYPKTTADISKFAYNGKISNTDVSRHDLTNKRHVEIGNIRTSRDNSKLPFDFLFDTETRRQPPSNFQFEAVKFLHQNKAISIIQPFSRASLFAGFRLDGETGFEPGLLSRAYLSTPSQILKTQLSPGSKSAPIAANDVPALRSLFGTKNVCHVDQLGGRVSQEQRHQVRSLFGRLSSSKSVHASAGRRHSSNNQNHVAIGLEHKFRKICVGTDPMPRVSRHYLGHNAQRKVPVGAEVPNATQSTSKTDRNRQLVPKAISILNGETQLRRIRRSKGTTSLSFTAMLQSTAANEPSLSQDSDPEKSDRGPGMVEGRNRDELANSSTCNNSSFNDGCLGYRLGGLSRRQKHIRSLDSAPISVARQSKGDVRGICSDFAGTEPVSRCSYSSANGQSNSRGIHKQGRRDKIKKASKFNSTASGDFGRAQHSPSSPILSGQVQRRSGRSVSSETLSRMASATTCHDEDISKVGNSSNRSLCLNVSSCDPKLCDSGLARPHGAASQRLLSPVELQSRVVVSPAKSHPDSPTSPERSYGEVHSDCPQMAQSVLAGRCTAESAGSSLSHSRSSTGVNRHDNGCTPTTSTRPAIGSLVDVGWQEILAGWTNQEQELLMSSWRSSTLNTYKSAWARWKK